MGIRTCDLVDGGQFFAIFGETCLLGSSRVRSRDFHQGTAACPSLRTACDDCQSFTHDVVMRVCAKVSTRLASGEVGNPAGLVRTAAGTLSEDLARERRTAHGALAKPDKLRSGIAAGLTEGQQELLRAMLFHVGGDSRVEADPWPYEYFAAQEWAAAAGWQGDSIRLAVDEVVRRCRTIDAAWTTRHLDEQLDRRRILLGPRFGGAEDWPEFATIGDDDEVTTLLDHTARLVDGGHPVAETLLNLVAEQFGNAARSRLKESPDLPLIVSWLSAERDQQRMAPRPEVRSGGPSAVPIPKQVA